MDPCYEQRLLHVQNGQHSSQSQIFRSPAKETYSDRFIPSRSSAIFQMKLNVKPDDRSQAVVQPSSNQKSNVDSCKDRVAYSCLLKNELLGAGIEDVKDQQMDGQRAALVPKETKNFFQYRIPSIASCSSELSPYSLSPVGNKSQRLLRSPRKALRKISRIPFKVLDAPELQDDFYLNLVDWSSQNILSVGLGSCVYLWSACTSQVTRLCDLSSEGDTVTSVSWNERGNLISVGTHKGFTQIWDVSATKKLSTLLGHQARVGALAWNADILASGSRDRMILLRDTRCPSVIPEKKLAGHRQEVCGLKWSPDHQHLASGGNDNKLYIWNMRSINPVQIYSEHMAAVKAIAWSPHQHGLLASGGGTADKRIRFWNTITGRPLQCIDTGSQVCNLAWSKHSSELVDTGEGITAMDEDSGTADVKSISDCSGIDLPTCKAAGGGEDVDQNQDSVVCEKHDSGSQPLPDCCVCLVRLPDFLLSQNSNDSSEGMVNKLTDADGLVRGDESSSLLPKNLLGTQKETLGEAINQEMAETPTRNKIAIDLLMCENTEAEFPQSDVRDGISSADNSKDIILVEDSQMPSCEPGQKELQTAVETEMCIMETPEKSESCEDESESKKPDQFPFRLFSDEQQGLAFSPEKLRETVNIQRTGVDDCLAETLLVTVVPDSCAIHVTLGSKDATPCDALLTVAVETAAVDDVQMEDAVAMETDEMNDSLSQSYSFQNISHVDSEISVNSIKLHLSDMEFITEPACLTPENGLTVMEDRKSAEGSLSGAGLTEKRSIGGIKESTEEANSSVELLEDSNAATTSMSDDEDQIPLAAYRKMRPLGKGISKPSTEGQVPDQQISTGDQIEPPAPKGIQEILELSSQTQDLPTETVVPVESEMQPSLTELPSAQPLQTQPKELEQQRPSQTADSLPSQLIVTKQLQSEKRPLIEDVISPEPGINISTSSEDDIPLGLLAKKHNILSDNSQTYLNIDADASSVLNSLGETQSKLVTKMRSRGRPKRSPYSSASTGLTLRSWSLVRAETDSLQKSECDRSAQRKSRKGSLTISVENTEIQGEQIVGENENKGEDAEDVRITSVTFATKKEDKAPKHNFKKQLERDEGTVDEVENQTESVDKTRNDDEIVREESEPENHNCERQREKVEEERKGAVELVEIDREDEEEKRLNEMEGGEKKSDTEKTRAKDRKLMSVTCDHTAMRKTAAESNNHFTQISDPKSAKNFPANKIKSLVISEDVADTIAVNTDDAAGIDDSDANGSIEVRHSAGNVSKRVAGLKSDLTTDSVSVASLISPVITSSASPASLRKSRTSDIPLTPTSSSTHRVLSRGHLMLNRSKQLFAMPNSGKLKMAPGGTESPKPFFLSVAETMRTRSQGSPLLLSSHVFSPSASPSAGILRKKRLREEAPSVDSPSPPHKHRRVCFSDKVDTIEIPNRYQQRRLQIPVAKDSSSAPGKQINRQLEMTNTPLNSASSPLSSKGQNLQKDSAVEPNETKDTDLTKMDIVLQDLYSMDCDPSDNPQVLTMTPESQLNCSEPVFPELINCVAPVDQILSKLTTTTWMIGLRQLLHAKNIKTIGNLSSLSELEVHNLPIVQPKVDNLRESLQAYARSNKMSLTDDTASKKNKLEVLATEQVNTLGNLQTKLDDSNPDGGDVLRSVDVTENNSSDMKQVNGACLIPEDDSGLEAEAVPAAETDIAAAETDIAAPASQPLRNISSETLIGEGKTEDHQEQLSYINMPDVELEEPGLLQATQCEWDEEFCKRLLNEDISRDRALRLLDFGLKLSNKCFQIVNGASSSK